MKPRKVKPIDKYIPIDKYRETIENECERMLDKALLIYTNNPKRKSLRALGWKYELTDKVGPGVRGFCRYDTKTVEVFRQESLDYYLETVRHEFAHAVQDTLYKDSRMHGKEWAEIKKAIDLESPDACPVRCVGCRIYSPCNDCVAAAKQLGWACKRVK